MAAMVELKIEKLFKRTRCQCSRVVVAFVHNHPINYTQQRASARSESQIVLDLIALTINIHEGTEIPKASNRFENEFGPA